MNKIPEKEQVKKNEMLSKDDVVLDSQNQDYTDEIVVLSSEKLKEEHRTIENQLWVATHGPGIRKLNSFTGTVHLTHPIDGDKMTVHRNDILGIAKPDVVKQYLEPTEQTQTMTIGGIE